MNINTLVTNNYELRMYIHLPPPTTSVNEIFSNEYLLYGLFKFQIRVKTIVNTTPNTNAQYNTGNVKTQHNDWIFVKFVNVSKSDFITIKFSSLALNINKITFTPDSIWHLIHETDTLSAFDFYFTVDIGSGNTQTKILYDDDELTDFELRGDDGTVKVHKCLLVTASSVVRALVLGDWKELKFLELKGISKATLEDFKTYIYSQRLPSLVSEQLLILAMRYAMPDMETACINSLIQNMSAQKLNELLDFAAAHKNVKLKMAILKYTQNNIIDIDLIRDHLIEKDDENLIVIPTSKVLN